MFKKARYIRWGVLLATLLVEVLALWIGGPAGGPNSSFSETFVRKLVHPMSWIWVGWASLSMAWLWAEVAFLFYANGRRIRAMLKRSRHEEFVFDTGVHWLVLLRDIHINRLNDGDKSKLEEGLFATDRKRSFAWYAIWLPVALAVLTMLFFAGWLAWAIRSIPTSAETWVAKAEASLSSGAEGALAEALQSSIHFFLMRSAALYDIVRQETLISLAVIFLAWFIFSSAARISRAQALLSNAFSLASQLSIAAFIFAMLSTAWFDWLTSLYAAIPHHGLAAVGFIPLTLASAFYFPHILFWSSWRYAIVRDTETHDATMVLLGGVLNSLQHRINLQRVVDTDIFQHWWERILNVGDIELKEMGGGEAEKIRHIFGPHQLLDHIRDAIRESKKAGGNQREFDDDDFGQRLQAP